MGICHWPWEIHWTRSVKVRTRGRIRAPPLHNEKMNRRELDFGLLMLATNMSAHTFSIFFKDYFPNWEIKVLKIARLERIQKFIDFVRIPPKTLFSDSASWPNYSNRKSNPNDMFFDMTQPRNWWIVIHFHKKRLLNSFSSHRWSRFIKK